MMLRRFRPRQTQGISVAFTVWTVWLFSVSDVSGQLSGLRDGDLTRPGSIEGRLWVPEGSEATFDGVSIALLGTELKTAPDMRGRYVLNRVAPGTYTLVASGGAFSILLITDVVLRPGQRLVLDAEEMPQPLREGEVHRMEPVIVSARTRIDELQRVEIIDDRPTPFASVNIDLPRSVNDAQPYYFFDRRTIVQSGATTLEEFVHRRVPMDATKFRISDLVTTTGGALGVADNKSSINLNGFGPEHTAILVNGRRLPSVSMRGAQNSDRQPDLNGIPLAAIERVELLPASSSAIYGSDAIGGAVNIVMRDDYQGAEIEATFENPYEGAAAIWRAAFTAGGNFDRGRTHVLVSVSHTDIQPVKYGARRDLLERSRARAWSNDPERAGAPSYAAVPLGTTTNVIAAPVSRAVNGQLVVTPGALFGAGTSDRTFAPEGYVGGGGRAAFELNAGRLNLEPAADASGRAPFLGVESPLEIETRISTGYTTLRRRFLPWLELFAEVSRSRNRGVNVSDPGGITADLPANAATNVFGVPVRVTARLPLRIEANWQEVIDERIVMGAMVELPGDWRVEADAMRVTNRMQLVGTQFESGLLGRAIQTGAVDVLRDMRTSPLSLEPYKSAMRGDDGTSVRSLNVRAAGPAARLAAGEIATTVGLGAKEDEMRDSVTSRRNLGPGATPNETRIAGATQRNLHAYGEVWLPVVSRLNAKRGVAQLDLQVAGRMDRFTVSDVDVMGRDVAFDVSNFTAGVRYRPVADVMFRGSYSTGFRAPDFAEIIPLPPPLAGIPFSPTGWLPMTLRDPKRGGEMTTQATVSFGGNPAIAPERSDNVTLGIVVEPRIRPGLRVSFDSTLIHRRDEIRMFPWQTIVDSENAFPGRVVREPVAAGDPFGVGRITFVDGTMINAPESRSLNYNLAIDYEWNTARSDAWRFSVVGNSWQHYERRSEPGRSFEEQINGAGTVTQDQPKFAGNAALNWARDRWSAGWAMRYVGHYRVSRLFYQANDGAVVPQQAYHDVYLGYAFPPAHGGRAGRLWSGVTLQVGAKNVFNTAPPFDATNARYLSPYGSLRLGSYYVSVRKRF